MDETDPVGRSEILYRLVPILADHYDTARKPAVSAEAFRPYRRDSDGLSLVRDAEFNTPEQAAERGPNRHGYYVVEIVAGDLIDLGLVLNPMPVEGVRGHVSAANLNAANRRSDQTERWIKRIVESLPLTIHGPFLKPVPPDEPTAG